MNSKLLRDANAGLAPPARRQRFDVAHRINYSGFSRSEGPLQRGFEIAWLFDPNTEATHRFRDFCQVNIFEDPHFTGSTALLSAVGGIK